MIICEIRDETGKGDPDYGYEIRISGIPEIQGEGNYHWAVLSAKQKDIAELIGTLCELLRKEREPEQWRTERTGITYPAWFWACIDGARWGFVLIGSTVGTMDTPSLWSHWAPATNGRPKHKPEGAREWQ